MEVLYYNKQYMEPVPTGKRNLYRVYLATLFFFLHYAMMIYVNSSFLENILGSKGKNFVGLLYVAGSILGILLLSKATHLMRLLGNKALMVIIAMVEIFSLLTLAFSHNTILIILSFILHAAIIPVLFFNFDIFVEHFSKHEESGKARGTFLSISNFCFVVMPLIAGITLTQLGFGILYIVSAVLVLPVVYFIATIKNFKDSEYIDLNIIATIKVALKNKDIKSIVIVNLILQMFYSSMVIYMPIYLHGTIGFSLQDIGLIFTVMLIPFVIFELPLGRLSDSWLGEKEILIIGLIILGGTTALLSLITSHALVVWAAMLFATRIGASFVEIMVESYFFKKIKNEDTELLSLWRSLNGISYIIVPSCISLLLIYIDLRLIFPIIGAVCFYGVFHALRLKDTL